MTTINTNIGAINASAALGATQRTMEVAMQRLSSGQRINRAADDAAGLSLSDRMTTNIRGLNMAVRNAVDAQALVNTSEGAQEEVTSILQRMRELAVQSSSDTNSTLDRLALQTEIAQLRAEIDRIAATTTWGGQSLLDGTFSGKIFQVGAVSGQTVAVTIDDTQSAALGQYAFQSTSTAGASVTSNASAKTVTDFDVVGYKGSAEAAFAAGSSAKTIAAAVNADTSSTGVTAKAANHAKVTLSAVPAGTVTFNLHGGASSAISASLVTNTDLTNLKDAINAASGTTGVTAKFDAGSRATLILTDADGDDIKFENFSDTGTATNLSVTAMNFDGTADIGSASTATSAATGVNDIVVTGTVKFSSTKAFSIIDQEAGSTDHTAAATGYFTAGTAGGTTSGGAGQLSAVSAINIGSQNGASNALDVLTVAIDKISQSRADLGAISNRLGNTMRNLTNIVSNTEASRSRIIDADFAKETTNLAKQQILSQAATAMLAQANASKQSVLTLLQA